MRRWRPGLLVLTTIVVLIGSGSAAAAPAAATCATSLPVGIQLEGLGRFADAEAYYAKQLETPAHRACASVLLGRLARTAGPCAYADFLKALGQGDKAREAYARAARARAGERCAEDGAEKPLLDRAETVVARAGRWVVLVLEALGVLTVLGVLVLCTARGRGGLGRWWRDKLLNARRVRRLLGARVQMNDYRDGGVTPALGAELTGRVRRHLRNPAPVALGEVKLVSGSEVLAQQLSGLKDLSPQLGIMVAVLGLLDSVLPREQFVADGVLHADVGRGVGVMLDLKQGKHKSANYAIEAASLFFLYAPGENAKAVDRLALPVAAWLEHQVATRSGADFVTCIDSGSYVLFRVALEWQRHGETELARALYEQAVDCDSRNAGALANGAIIKAEGHRFDEAILDLRRALGIVEAGGATP